MIPVPPAKALLVNPEALPVGELAVLVLDELEVLLDLLLEPQAVSTAAAITAAATRLAVHARARRGSFKREDVMVGSAPFGGEGKGERDLHTQRRAKLPASQRPFVTRL
jgi:hypothetical protein